MKLNEETLNKVRESKTCKAKLAEALQVHPATISRYIDGNDIKLTTAAALAVICEYFNLETEQALEYVAQ